MQNTAIRSPPNHKPEVLYYRLGVRCGPDITLCKVGCASTPPGISTRESIAYAGNQPFFPALHGFSLCLDFSGWYCARTTADPQPEPWKMEKSTEISIPRLIQV